MLSVQRQTPLLSGEKEHCLPVAVAHGMYHLHINSGCSWTSICDESITDAQAMSSSPLPCTCRLLSSDPVLPWPCRWNNAWATPCHRQGTGQREQDGEWMFRQAPRKYRVKREVPGQPAWPPAATPELHRSPIDRVSHLSAWHGLSWEHPGVWQWTRCVHLNKPSPIAPRIMVANRTLFFYPVKYCLSKLFGVKTDVARVPVESALTERKILLWDSKFYENLERLFRAPKSLTLPPEVTALHKLYKAMVCSASLQGHCCSLPNPTKAVFVLLQSGREDL